MNYYNEIEPFVAKWLTKLIKAGLISRGKVDGRSIRDVRPADIKANRTHFFAGIGGWDYALGLAGWPEDREVWTGSCPCQPFSLAGNRKGQADERHLWPEWFRLIRECRPSTIFGEQVGSAIGHGWLDLVFDDLEAEGYACGAVVLPACGVGAPHIRQRLWFVAHSNRKQGKRENSTGLFGDALRGCELGDSNGNRCNGAEILLQPGRSFETGFDASGPSPLGDSHHERSQGHTWHESNRDEPGRDDTKPGGSVSASNPWATSEWVECRDGKARPIKPGLEPLVDGLPGRVGRLCAYGNAIVPQLAAEFIRCAM